MRPSARSTLSSAFVICSKQFVRLLATRPQQPDNSAQQHHYDPREHRVSLYDENRILA